MFEVWGEDGFGRLQRIPEIQRSPDREYACQMAKQVATGALETAEVYAKVMVAEQTYRITVTHNVNAQPYLKKVVSTTQYTYNPNYGDDRICQCGHPYYRHFDSYEDMEPVGCKYCGCMGFVEEKGEE